MKPNSKLKPYLGPRPKMFRPVLIDDIAIPKRCRKPRSWIHYIKDGLTACGKDTYCLFCGPRMTDKVENVTCPRCIEVLKKTHWYCPEHGFIDDENVTFGENCEFCGAPV